MKKIYKLFVFVTFTIILGACGDEDKPTPNPIEEEEKTPNEIASFIWEGLDVYYLWENEIEALALTKNTEEWKKYLNDYDTDYEGLFESLLYRKRNANGKATVDKWSWFIEDYVKQEEAFAGISKSFGFEYKLSTYGKDGNDVFGYVTYVIPNSPAANTSLKRGDIFISVNGEYLTLANYRDLLFSNETYTLGFADLKNETVVANKKEVSLTAVELTENPILMAKKIEGTKVGYMVYNSFIGTEGFNKALNDSIGKLKSEGITELVLDLRYNGGGSVYTAILLASMIDGQHTGQVFSESKYNNAIQARYVKKYGADVFKDRFVDKITKKVNGKEEIVATLNSLGLQRLFVLTSESTASASELIINGLDPYIDVILIGTSTHGKYVGSITVYDYIDSKGTKNPNHKYAMQPIVLKIANSKGVTDYREGFAPDYVRNEWTYLGDIKPLGDPEEPYLKAALGIIAGENVAKEDSKAEIATKAAAWGDSSFVFDSKDLKPLGKEMYDERIQLNMHQLRK